MSIIFSRVHADNLANVDEDKGGRKGASDPYVVFSERGVRLVDMPQEAIEQMGTTVTGGAITTFFASIVLLTCLTDTLYKFGVMLMTTIVAAFLTGTVFFPAFFLPILNLDYV